MSTLARKRFILLLFQFLSPLADLVYPDAKLVNGYDEAAMPSYEGLVTPADLEAISAYIRSLR